MSRRSISSRGRQVTLRWRDSDIEPNLSVGDGGLVVDGEVRYWAEGHVEGTKVWTIGEDAGRLDVEVGVGWNNVGGSKKAADDGAETITDEVVASPFGDMFAVEDVFAFGIDEGATDACWQVGWGKDVEEQFAFEGEEEEVVGAAVAFVMERGVWTSG